MHYRASKSYLQQRVHLLPQLHQQSPLLLLLLLLLVCVVIQLLQLLQLAPALRCQQRGILRRQHTEMIVCAATG